MPLKTRRQNRYTKLRNAGFLPFEARPLSKVPFKTCPYMRQLIRERREEARQAIKEGLSRRQWEDFIKARYGKNNWTSYTRTGKVKADPWKMLREYEDRWRNRQPDYTSPWEDKYRKWRDFIVKIERTMAKQKGLG